MRDAAVDVTVYDVAGRLVKLAGQGDPAAPAATRRPGTVGRRGREVTRGVYFVRARFGAELQHSG